MRALSLGYDCKVAYQIRRWTSLRAGVAEPSFFDWLMTPAAALDFVLGSDGDLLRSGRWELINGDSSLRELDSGLMFMHEFPSVAVEGGEFAHRILAEQVEQHLPTARAKFAYLRNKILNFIHSTPNLVLVRSDDSWTSAAESVEQANRIRQLLLPLNSSLKFVLASTNLPASARVGLDTLLFKTAHGADWRGDDASWDVLFSCAERWLLPQVRAAELQPF